MGALPLYQLCPWSPFSIQTVVLVVFPWGFTTMFRVPVSPPYMLYLAMTDKQRSSLFIFNQKKKRRREQKKKKSTNKLETYVHLQQKLFENLAGNIFQ
jgi:hypothetical protein